MKYFKYLFLAVLIFLPLFSYAETSFSFATDPQSVPVSPLSGPVQLSGPIQIQASAKVSETTYLILTSTSPTGHFMTSTAKLLGSVSIASGAANRTVYYEDSTAGDFVITAVIQNQAKTITLTTISQHIFIGQPVSGDNSDSNSNDTTATTTTDTSGADDSSDSSTTAGAYSSTAPLSNTDANISFQVSAGRDRLATVGGKLEFRAVVTQIQDASADNINYTWSFGDGTTAQGSDIQHMYKFPGDYQVVLNASYSDQLAVSTADVTVVAPNVSIARVDGGVQIGNNSGVEINLQDWQLVSPKKYFTFPQDTLIPNGKKVIFGNDVTGMDSAGVELVNPIGKSFGAIDAENVSVVSSTQTQTQIATTSQMSLADIQAKVNAVKAQFGLVSPQYKSQNIPSVAVAPKSKQLKVSAPVVSIQTNDQSAVAVEAFATSSQTSFVGSLLSLPMRGFNFIKHLFVEQ